MMAWQMLMCDNVFVLIRAVVGTCRLLVVPLSHSGAKAICSMTSDVAVAGNNYGDADDVIATRPSDAVVMMALEEQWHGHEVWPA